MTIQKEATPMRVPKLISPTRLGPNKTGLGGNRRSSQETICSKTRTCRPSRGTDATAGTICLRKISRFLSARHGALLGRAPAERLNRKIIETMSNGNQKPAEA